MKSQKLWFLNSIWYGIVIDRKCLMANLVKLYLKVSKSRKQISKFSHTPKNQRNSVHFFALASKSD